MLEKAVLAPDSVEQLAAYKHQIEALQAEKARLAQPALDRGLHAAELVRGGAHPRVAI